MDLALQGRSAIVCAASKGLGRGCAEKLAEAGVNLTICARTKETLEATADAIRSSTGVNVKAIACDITSDAGRSAVLEACPAPDILINNAGGPPPGDFDQNIERFRTSIRRSAQRAHARRARKAFRNRRRIWRYGRLPRLAIRRLYHRPKYRSRRWQLPWNVLTWSIAQRVASNRFHIVRPHRSD